MAATLVTLLLALTASACDKPSSDRTTSPSALALVGTATGEVAIRPSEQPPAEPAAPDGWQFDVGSARFSTLEDGSGSIQVVNDLQASPGAAVEVWLEDADGAVAVWRAAGETTTTYSGTLCFQLRLEDGDEALTLATEPFTVTLVFRHHVTGDPIAVSRMPVHGSPPALDGSAPSPGSEVFRDLLGCPRSVI